MATNPDIYELLIGSGADTPEKMKAAVEALRRDRYFGDVGMMTGDRVMSPFGQNLAKRVEDQQRDLQKIRQFDINTETLKRGQDLSVLEERIRASRPQAGRAPKSLRIGDRQDLQETSGALDQIRDMQHFMEKGGKLGAVAIAGMDIPVVGGLLRGALNVGGRYNLGTDDKYDDKGNVTEYGTKTTSLQWQNYKRLYELAERYNLFGATLTGNEKADWAAANPAATQNDEYIARGMKVLEKIYNHRRNQLVTGLSQEGYNPDAIASYSSLRGPIDSASSGREEEPDEEPDGDGDDEPPLDEMPPAPGITPRLNTRPPGGRSAPEAAVRALEADPRLWEQFYEKYGYVPGRLIPVE